MHIYRLITFCDPVSLRTARLLSFFSFFSAAFPGLALACIDSRARDASVIRYTFATPRLRSKTRRRTLLACFCFFFSASVSLSFLISTLGGMVYILIYVCVRACVRACVRRVVPTPTPTTIHQSHTIHHRRYRTQPWCAHQPFSRRVFHHETHRRNRDTIRTHGIARPGCPRLAVGVHGASVDRARASERSSVSMRAASRSSCARSVRVVVFGADDVVGADEVDASSHGVEFGNNSRASWLSSASASRIAAATEA